MRSEVKKESSFPPNKKRRKKPTGAPPNAPIIIPEFHNVGHKPVGSIAEASQLSPFKPRVVRQYSASERANALAVYDTVGTLEKTAEALGIPLSTLAGWVNDPSNFSELRNQKREELSAKFENAAHLFLDLAVKKSKKAGFNHLMTGAGIAVDKSQLLKGLPTAISGSVMSDDERKLKLAEILSRLESRVIDVARALPENADITQLED